MGEAEDRFRALQERLVGAARDTAAVTSRIGGAFTVPTFGPMMKDQNEQMEAYDDFANMTDEESQLFDGVSPDQYMELKRSVQEGRDPAGFWSDLQEKGKSLYEKQKEVIKNVVDKFKNIDAPNPEYDKITKPTPPKSKINIPSSLAGIRSRGRKQPTKKGGRIRYTPEQKARIKIDDLLADEYESPYQEQIDKARNELDDLDYVKKYADKLRSAEAKADLSWFLSYVDSETGSNLMKGYKTPTTKEEYEKQAFAVDSIVRREQKGILKDLLALEKNARDKGFDKLRKGKLKSEIMKNLSLAQTGGIHPLDYALKEASLTGKYLTNVGKRISNKTALTESYTKDNPTEIRAMKLLGKDHGEVWEEMIRQQITAIDRDKRVIGGQTYLNWRNGSDVFKRSEAVNKLLEEGKKKEKKEKFQDSLLGI